MHGFMRLYTLYGRLLAGVAVLAGFATFAMMWLVDVNVIGRKLLNMPVMGSVEISQALLVFCVLLGLPHAQATGAHLRVTVLVRHFPRSLRKALYVLASLAGATIFALLAWSSWGFMMRAYNVGEQVWGAAVRFPLWPVKAMIPLGATLLAVQFVLDALRVGWLDQVEPRDEIDPAQAQVQAHE